MTVYLDKMNTAAIMFRPAAILRNASTATLTEITAMRSTDPFAAYDIDTEIDARFAMAPAYNDRLRKAPKPTHLDICRAAYPAPTPAGFSVI